MSDDTLILGAVAYDAKVVPIWDGFRAWFGARGLGFDYVLYTNYERQVEAHLRGEVHVAWSSPLAWIEAVRRADGPIHTLGDLRGKRVGVGAADSPQATLIPLLALAEAGVEPDRCEGRSGRGTSRYSGRSHARRSE